MIEHVSKHMAMNKPKGKEKWERRYLCNLSCSFTITLIIITESKNENKEYQKL